MSRDEIYLELCRAVEGAPFYALGEESELERAYYPNAYRLLVGLLPQTEKLVRMCKKDCGGVSDYEKFEDICSAFPMLVGSTVHSAAREILRRLFNLEMPINKENAPKIWSACCGDGLGIGGGEIIRALDLRCIPVCRILSVLDGAGNAAELLSRAEDLCKKALREKGILSISLPDDFEFVRPSVYGVNGLLSKTREGGEVSSRDRDMLTAQCLRSIMPYAKESGFSIYLSAKAGGELAALLEYLNGSVGLSDVLLVARSSTAELKKFMFSLPPDILDFVLPAGAEEASPEDALRGYMHVFPIERLSHLGFLSEGKGFANVAEQCAMRVALCKMLAYETEDGDVQRASATVRRICCENIYDVIKGETEL